jgi:heat shock protein HslJ
MVVTLPFDEPDVKKIERVQPSADVPDWVAERLRERAAERAEREAPPPPPHLTLSEYTCRDHLALADENPGPAGVRIVWALGYHYGESKLDDTWPPLTHARVVEFTERVMNLCETQPEALWFDVVRGLAPEPVRREEISTPIDLDPARYTCQRHVELAASESHLAEVRAVFADGYVSFHQGVDKSSPPITAHDIVAFEQSILAHCKANPSALWIHAVRHESVHRARADLALTWDELANATYHGIYETPVTLRNGLYEKERGRLQLIRDFRLDGHLHGDGLDEAVVLLTESSGGRGGKLYLAVVAHAEGGAETRGAALVGEGVQVAEGRIADGRIELDVVQTGPEEPTCCPSERSTRRWFVGSSALREDEPELTGTLSLADLEGVDWILTHFGENEPVSDVEVSLYFERNRVAGHGGCNRFFADVTEGASPGAIAIGPIGATRMACPGAASDVESRFLRELERVKRYGFAAGKLALSTETATMLFARAK